MKIQSYYVQSFPSRLRRHHNQIYISWSCIDVWDVVWMGGRPRNTAKFVKIGWIRVVFPSLQGRVVLFHAKENKSVQISEQKHLGIHTKILRAIDLLPMVLKGKWPNFLFLPFIFKKNFLKFCQTTVMLWHKTNSRQKTGPLNVFQDKRLPSPARKVFLYVRVFF